MISVHAGRHKRSYLLDVPYKTMTLKTRFEVLWRTSAHDAKRLFFPPNF